MVRYMLMIGAVLGMMGTTTVEAAGNGGATRIEPGIGEPIVCPRCD